MSDKWRKWPGVIAAGLLLVSTAGRAEVPLAQDLREAAGLAEKSCAPVLLEFAADYCDYCELLETEILAPTLLDPDYDRRVQMRKLLIDSGNSLRGFDNRPTDAATLAGQYNIMVTPTVVFVDRDGNEIAERLVGISSVDFYGAYLDMSLDQSRQRLRELGRCKPTKAQSLLRPVANVPPDLGQ